MVRRCRRVHVLVLARSEVPDTAGNAREFHMLPQRLTEDSFERLRNFVVSDSEIGVFLCDMALFASLCGTVSMGMRSTLRLLQDHKLCVKKEFDRTKATSWELH